MEKLERISELNPTEAAGTDDDTAISEVKTVLFDVKGETSKIMKLEEGSEALGTGTETDLRTSTEGCIVERDISELETRAVV